MTDADRLTKVCQRMLQEDTLWMATTRPDGRPHVAPIWFVWHDDCAYVMTGGVKLVNVRRNGFAALNTEDGSKVVIVEGTARVVPLEEALFNVVAEVFIKKYDWDIHDSLDQYELIEVKPVKTLVWNA